MKENKQFEKKEVKGFVFNINNIDIVILIELTEGEELLQHTKVKKTFFYCCFSSTVFHRVIERKRLKLAE